MTQWTNTTTYIQQLNQQLPVYGNVAFPATQVPSSNANYLDDYEEGTYTVVLTFGGGSTGITYSVQTGSYTKMGNRCMGNGYAILTAKGSSTGAAKLSLPLAVRNNNDSYAAISVFLRNVAFANAFQAFVNIGASTLQLSETTEAGAETTLADTDFANNSEVMFSFNYRTE